MARLINRNCCCSKKKIASAAMRGVIILACLVCWSSGFSLTKLPLSRVGCSVGMSSSRLHLAQSMSLSMSSVEDAARMARRDAVLSALAAFVTIPTAARADDAADVEKLRQEAARISGLIEKTKQASLPDAPSFSKNAVNIPEANPKVAEAPKATKPSGPKPDPKLEPKQVVKVILELLINNDNPSENAGMKTVLDFSSSVNPYVNQPPERFFQAMRNSAYSILLGGYEDAKVGKPDVGKGDDGVPYQVFPIKVSAKNRAFLIAGVEPKYLYDKPDGGSFCVFNFILSQDLASKSWLLDTVYLVANKAASEE